jgi:F-type H+-transporting ATPase subunit a
MAKLEPEIIFNFFGFGITNTLLATFLTDLVLIAAIIAIKKNISIYPGKLQLIAEEIIGYLYNLTSQVCGGYSRRVESIFPWFASFFIFIFSANLLGLLPGFGTLGIFENEHGFIPVLRAATSDFNTTFALAIVSLVATHFLSVKYLGIKEYLQRFISLNPAYLFVGIMEAVSEIVKIFSLSFRLFGNIFAGEVVLSTISSLFAFVAPIPFLLLELIVAFVQAFIFAILTMAFMSILTTAHQGGEQHT